MRKSSHTSFLLVLSVFSFVCFVCASCAQVHEMLQSHYGDNKTISEGQGFRKIWKLILEARKPHFQSLESSN